MDKFESLLKFALEAKSEPNESLNECIMRQARRDQSVIRWNIRKMAAVAALAITVVAVSGGTVYAAWKYLNPKEAATEVGDQKLADAFGDRGAAIEHECQTENGYKVTMLGVVSGKNISDNLITDDNGTILEDRSYIVTAFAKEDGTAFEESEDNKVGQFYVSPYIKGQDPAKVNIYHMDGVCHSFIKNGIYYRILECNDLEIFADQGVYLGVCDKELDEVNAYRYNKTTGEITVNKDYDGLNMLFEVPMDKSKADESAAQEKIKEWDEFWSDAKHKPSPVFDEKDSEARKWTPEAIEMKAEIVKNTVKTLKPDADGYIDYSWEALGMSGDGKILEQWDEFETGVVTATGFYYLENGKCVIETCTKNADGTVTMAIYVEK